MKKHLFLTGDIHVGKSTLLRCWLKQSSLRTGGFYTKKVDAGDEAHVHIFSAAFDEAPSDETFLFNCMNRDLEDTTRRFNTRGCALLDHPEDYDLIVMDEIGVMENRAELFREKVIETLNGHTPVVGVLRKSLKCCISSVSDEGCDNPLVKRISDREDVEVIEVTLENRDELAEKLPDVFL